MSKQSNEEIRGHLVRMFKAAKTAVEQVVGDDDGTCNLDSAVFYLGNVRSKMVQSAAEEAGVLVQVSTLYGGRAFFVGLPYTGQANRRARQAQAAVKAMRLFERDIPGMTASVYYQMD